MFYTNLMIFFLAAMFLMRIGKGSGRFVKARGFIFILLMVSLAGLYLTLHAWLQDFLLFSQYLVLLAAPMLVVFFEFISELFQKSRKILSLFLLVSMLGCLCLPPLVNEYSSKWNNFNLNRRLKCFDQVILSTKKSDKCLSVEFPCPFRLAGYFYRMCWPGLESRSIINHDEEALIDEILHQNVVVIVPSQVYFFMPQLLYLIHKNYVLGDYSFYTPGQIWGPSQVEKVEQDVLVSGYYQIAGWEGVSIDGRSLKQGTIYLSKGMHIFDLPDRQKMYGFFYDVKLNLAPSG